MELKDIYTLKDISKRYDIPLPTLKTRLQSKHRGLKKDIDYRKIGDKNIIIFSPQGVEKMIKKL